MSFSSSRRPSYDVYYEKLYNEMDEDDYTPSPAVSSTINSFSRSPSSAAQTIAAEEDERAKNVDTDSDFSDDDQPFHDIDFDEHIAGINFYESLPTFNDIYTDPFAAGSFFPDMPDSPTESLYINPSNVQPDHNAIPLPQSPAPAPVFNLDTFKPANDVETPLLPTSETTETSSLITETPSLITEDRPIIPLRAGARTTRARRQSVIIAPSDNEDSDNEPDDDEDYCPSPLLNPKKRRRSSQPAAPAPKKAKVATTPAPASSSTSSLAKPKVARKPRLPPAPRNVQVVGINLLDLLDTMNWKCQACIWEQENHRKPDFVRHLLTHQQPDKNDQSKGFWCKGLKLVDREAYNKLAIHIGREPIPENAEEIVYLFEQRVGGCMRNFSRLDALKRHIDNPNNSCCGHALKPFQEFDFVKEKIFSL